MNSAQPAMKLKRTVLFLTSQRSLLKPVNLGSFRLLVRCLVQSAKKEEHLIRTASQFRQPRMYEGIVDKIEDPSDDVRTISLRVSANVKLTFKAGQWVDFYIPHVQPVVGFSMTSGPHLAESQGTLDLAVRYSIYPPTYWIHRQCKLGDAVTIRVGGEFFYDPENDKKRPPHDLLLIGGGVGINPLVSIASHYAHVLTTGKLGEITPPNKMIVLYSAKSQKALVFREEFRNLSKVVPSMSCNFFATSDPVSQDLPSDTFRRRLNREDIDKSLSLLNRSNVVAYICGPSLMTDAMVELLHGLGLPPDRVCFEKWW